MPTVAFTAKPCIEPCQPQSHLWLERCPNMRYETDAFLLQKHTLTITASIVSISFIRPPDGMEFDHFVENNQEQKATAWLKLFGASPSNAMVDLETFSTSVGN